MAGETGFMAALRIGAERAGVELPTWDEKRLPGPSDGQKTGVTDSKPTAPRSPSVFSLKSLRAQSLPPPRWAVPTLLPEGLFFLAGKPKMGKSWMALAFAIAIAGGGRVLGRYEVERGDVLYLALEDSPRRLQKRARILMGNNPTPDALDLVHL